MSTRPTAHPLPPTPPARLLEPDDAVDLVMSLCLRGAPFVPEQDFWETFAHAYARVESRVDPGHRFAFAIEVDSRLVHMGLAPWSVMGRTTANQASEAAQGNVRTT